MTENERIERKSAYDPADLKARYQLVKEIVAMANTATGGEIHFGVEDDGTVVGLTPNSLHSLDPAKLRDAVDSCISPDHIELEVRRESAAVSVAVVIVPPHPDPPLVFATTKNIHDQHGRQIAAIRAGDVYVRKGTQATRANRADFQTWMRRAARREREALLERFAYVVELPTGTELRAVLGDEELDEPTALLKRAVAAWRRDSAKLLSGPDLLSLLVAGQNLSPDAESAELILQSALRRRPSLWHWLVLLEPRPEEIPALLTSAISGRDRDKSDAGRAIVEVAALYVGDAEYAQIVADLAASDYKHFREAAEDGKDRDAVIARLRAQALPGPSDQGESQVWSESKELCVEILSLSSANAQRRRLTKLGLELFARSRGGGALLRPDS